MVAAPVVTGGVLPLFGPMPCGGAQPDSQSKYRQHCVELFDGATRAFAQ